MKNIISYKLFESSESQEEIKQYLRDIFQELVDIGFVCLVFGDWQHTEIQVYIDRRDNDQFNFSEVDEYIKSAVDYMSSIGFNAILLNPFVNFLKKKMNPIFPVDKVWSVRLKFN